MQNTTNLNLKKPEYTDFADIQDINDNMDTLDDAIHDTQNSVATFTSSDVADGSATSWTTVPKVASGETHKSIFAKMSQMFKNIRFLYKLLGTTDISNIGDGTVTGGLSSLNDSFANHFFKYPTNARFGPVHAERISTSTIYSLTRYAVGTVLLVSYSNGGLLIITKWGASDYHLDIIHASVNAVTPSIVNNEALLMTLGSGTLTHISIIQLK